MKGFTHFLTPNGKASVVEEGPWHYGVDYMAVYFMADRRAIAKLLPPALKVGDGTSVAYVCEFVSVSGTNPEAVYENPDQTVYREAALGTSCFHRGQGGIYLAYVWVDRDWAMIRGWLLGVPKKIADEIQMTRLHPLNPLIGPLKAGTRLSGYCTRHGQRLLTVRLHIKRKGGPEDVLKFPSTYGLRHFPATHETQTPVNEVVEVLKSNFRVDHEVWVGDGKVELGQAVDEELELIKPQQMLYGCYYRAGFTNLGSRVLSK